MNIIIPALGLGITTMVCIWSCLEKKTGLAAFSGFWVGYNFAIVMPNITKMF